MKILGSDYDGTLTYGMGTRTFEAISAWRKAGHVFGIVSGRPASFREDVLKSYPALELDFFVAFNGAVITDGQGHLLYERKCAEVSATELTRLLLDWHCPFVHVNSDAYYCVVSRMEDAPSWIPRRDVILPDALPPLPYFHQISTQFPGDEASAHTVTQRLRRIYGSILNPLQNASCIDIPAKGINKTHGLLMVAEHFGARPEDVIAVGDHINDTDMIRDFYSYAMANGVDSVKELADKITLSVADLIEAELDP